MSPRHASDHVADRAPGPLIRRRLVLALFLVLLLTLVWTAWQAYQTQRALRAAEVHGRALAAALRSQDEAGAARSARLLRRDGDTAHSASSGPVWRLARHLPWWGDDIAAVQDLSEALDITGRRTVPAALDVVGSLRGGQLRGAGGQIDLPRLGRLAPRLRGMAVSSASAAALVEPIRPADLTSALSGPVRQARDVLVRAAGLAHGGEVATDLLPQMLGGGAPRNYLLIVQNNAEIRSTGGLPGSVLQLRAADGRLRLVHRRTGSGVLPARRSVLPLTQEETALFGTKMGRDFRDTNFTPDFPRAAQLMAELYRRQYGLRADGVLSVDPVALSYLLEATGPVRVDGEELTTANAIDILLNRTYQRLDTQDLQDAYFARAAGAIFDGVVLGAGDQERLVGRLGQAAGEGRLLVWSRRSDEEAKLAGTAVAGALAGASRTDPVVGMYLSDGTGAKMQYYLRYSGQVTSSSCRSGRQAISATMTLRSVAPPDIVKAAPSVVGIGNHTPLGNMRMVLRVLGPWGGRIVGATAGAQRLDLTRLQISGRPATTLALVLRPGEMIRLRFDVVGRRGQTADPSLEMTPGIERRGYDSTATSSCS